MNVDFYDVFNNLDEKQRKEFIKDNLNEISDEYLAGELARRAEIDVAINAYPCAEIEEWLKQNAYEFGFIEE